MIVTVFVILLTISVFLIGLGYAVNESVYPTIGFVFLFILAITIIMPGNLEYRTGDNTTITYSYDINSTLISQNEISTYQYEEFDNSSSRWFGLWLTIIFGAGIAISTVEITQLIRKRREEE